MFKVQKQNKNLTFFRSKVVDNADMNTLLKFLLITMHSFLITQRVVSKFIISNKRGVMFKYLILHYICNLNKLPKLINYVIGIF